MHDSRDTRERYYFLLLLLLSFIHSFIHSFMYLAEGMTRVILERERYYYSCYYYCYVFTYLFVYSFMYLAEGMTGVILGPGGLPTIVCMLVVVLAIFLVLVL